MSRFSHLARRTKMNKAEAVQQFREEVLPAVKATYEQDGKKDRIARREAWNNFTDALCKDGQITLSQYETWTHPRECD